MLFARMTEVLHSLVAAEKGNTQWHTAVDATMGNGNDSLFLYHLLGDGLERLYAFDLQAQAVESTRQLLEGAGADLSKVVLVQEGHEHLKRHVEGPVDAALFNLGYLPKSDKSIATQGETTVAALGSLAARLSSGGVIGILSYRGHDGGMAEHQAVAAFAAGLDYRIFDVVHLDWSNRPNDPPCMIVIRKK